VTVGVQRMVPLRCAVTLGVHDLRHQIFQPGSWPIYLPTECGETLLISFRVTTAAQNSYCYCVNLAEEVLFKGSPTASFVVEFF